MLAQGRSRDTRQAIIKAALELWSERGYDTGIDDTTAEEIAARAGVAKATFYLHFARKDDILLETGWLTAKVFYEDALKALLEGGPAEQVIDAITVKLTRRVERVPRLALQRMLRAQGAAGPRTVDDPDRFGFRRAFAVILLHAQQGGDMPRTVSPDSLGRMFEAQLMAVIRDWALEEDDTELLATLRERFAILLAGARNVPADASWPGGRALGPQHPLQREPRDSLNAAAQLDRDGVDDLLRGPALEQCLERVLVEHLGGEPAGLEQDVVLAREVQVERGLRDPRPGGYLLGGGVVDPGVVPSLAP